MEHEGCNSCTESSSMAIKSYGAINPPLPQLRLHAYSVLLITPCPTVLFPALSLSLRITLCLSLSPGPSPHLEGWQTTAGPPPPICPSGQSLFGKLSTDHVNRGQHVRWWTSVQMSPVETAVVCLLLRVFPALQGLLFPSTDPTYKERAAHPYWP